MKILYFAWVRERLGLAEETAAAPASVTDVGGLLAWLATLSPRHAETFSDASMVRVAINYEHARLDQPVAPDDEVALFPPVTGG